MRRLRQAVLDSPEEFLAIADGLAAAGSPLSSDEQLSRLPRGFEAAKGTKVEGALRDLAGVTSIAYTTGDPVAMAKALLRYAKDTPDLTFKIGVVEGRVVTIKEIESLATMPSKEELMSKLLFLINAPAQRLATAISAVPRNLAVVIDQAVQQKKFKEA